ncbi:MAG: diacylglycerol kinase family protein [Oscillospiraceae bacterium]|nr:diacylglycerol kinase family protein [Oscillospiraceae bacterium]
MTTALYNPLACNGHGRENAAKLAEVLDEQISFKDIRETKISDIPAEDKIVICGGDGTISHFVNTFGEPERDIYYYPAGSGNDFTRDIGESSVILLNPYLKNLPTVEVKGKSYKVLNGVGYGIDGYCCEVGDEMRAKNPGKEINYTSIAIKGLLFHFKPANATVTVDGKEHKYKKAWLAPAMNGRYYGGGMCIAPEQDRLNAERKLSVVLMYGSGKLKTLMVFPSIFKGEHVKHTEMVEILTGHTIEVKFDRPTALQVDGETIKNVESYVIKSAAVAEKEKELAEAK